MTAVTTRRKWLWSVVAVVGAAGAAPARMPAQGWRTMRVPPNLRAELQAQGERFARKGKERVTIVGRLTDADERSRSVSLIRDIRGRFRVAFAGRVLAFDGARESSAGGALNAEQAAAAESLLDDSMEAFFAAVDRGDVLRLLGRRFRADDGAAPGYQGPWHDIYELRWRGRLGAEDRVKLFYFDSATGLPARVRYRGRDGEVETLMGQWREFAGEYLPLAIVRTVKGRLQFTFAVDSVVLTADKDDGVFRAEN